MQIPTNDDFGQLPPLIPDTEKKKRGHGPIGPWPGKKNFLEYHQQETASPPEKPASYSGL